MTLPERSLPPQRRTTRANSASLRASNVCLVVLIFLFVCFKQQHLEIVIVSHILVALDS